MRHLIEGGPAADEAELNREVIAGGKDGAKQKYDAGLAGEYAFMAAAGLGGGWGDGAAGGVDSALEQLGYMEQEQADLAAVHHQEELAAAQGTLRIRGSPRLTCESPRGFLVKLAKPLRRRSQQSEESSGLGTDQSSDSQRAKYVD